MSFKITKALIEAYVNNGYSVRMMAEDITSKSSVKCSDATVRHACKTYGINLRNKRMPSHFVLEDLDKANPVSPLTEAMQNGGVTLVQPAEVVEEQTVQL